jgi:hypothetical protein
MAKAKRNATQSSRSNSVMSGSQASIAASVASAAQINEARVEEAPPAPLPLIPRQMTPEIEMTAAMPEKKIWPFQTGSRKNTPPRSLSKKSGLVFPVLKMKRILDRGHYAENIRKGERPEET